VSEHKAAPAAVPGQASHNLLMRVAAALVLAPLTIGAAYAGGWFWTVLVLAAAIGLYLEWLTIVSAPVELRASVIGSVALTIAGSCLALRRFDAALAVTALGLAAIALLSPRQRLWTAAGFLYAGMALAASLLVRLDQDEGLAALVLVLLVVWATDIGGYFAGRGIGGRKLWPSVSPNKTWAGAIGGLVASLVVAGGFAAFGLGKGGPMLVLAACLSIASQFGDLFESAVKRRFGVKDSSHIIPGHGGLMDRLDGYVAAIVLAAIFGVLRGGVDGVGRALMVW
jgi:phosphatidate cytidylyltransferase